MRIKTIQYFAAIAILCLSNTSTAGTGKQNAIIKVDAKNINISNISKGSKSGIGNVKNNGNQQNANINIKANNVNIINNKKDKELCIGCVSQ